MEAYKNKGFSREVKFFGLVDEVFRIEDRSQLIRGDKVLREGKIFSEAVSGRRGL